MPPDLPGMFGCFAPSKSALSSGVSRLQFSVARISFLKSWQLWTGRVRLRKTVSILKEVSHQPVPTSLGETDRVRLRKKVSILKEVSHQPVPTSLGETDSQIEKDSQYFEGGESSAGAYIPW